MTADNAIDKPVDVGWLINGFVKRVHGVAHALMLSADELPLTAFLWVSSDDAEQLAAIASGLLGLARSGAALFGKGTYELSVIRLSRGYFFFMGDR